MASISTAAREPAEALAPQVKRATRALLKHVRKQGGGKKQLIETHETVSLMIGLRAIPKKGNTGKPLRIAIPHSLHGEDPQICLFVKEEAAKLLKTRLDKTPVPGLAKVIGLDKLRKTYKQYADKRELCASYDLFVADERILPMLAGQLGKTFFAAKKQPIAVKIQGNKLDKSVKSARDSTFLYLGRGDCVAVRVGRTDFAEDDLAENVVAAMMGAVDRIKGGWGNIQCINLKTTSSVALPLYNSLDTTATAVAVPEEKVDEEGEEGEEEEEETATATRKRKSAPGKKDAVAKKTKKVVAKDAVKKDSSTSKRPLLSKKDKGSKTPSKSKGGKTPSKKR